METHITMDDLGVHRTPILGNPHISGKLQGTQSQLAQPPLEPLFIMFWRWKAGKHGVIEMVSLR